jgi:hypothetical protein
MSLKIVQYCNPEALFIEVLAIFLYHSRLGSSSIFRFLMQIFLLQKHFYKYQPQETFKVFIFEAFLYTEARTFLLKNQELCYSVFSLYLRSSKLRSGKTNIDFMKVNGNDENSIIYIII